MSNLHEPSTSSRNVCSSDKFRMLGVRLMDTAFLEVPSFLIPYETMLYAPDHRHDIPIGKLKQLILGIHSKDDYLSGRSLTIPSKKSRKTYDHLLHEPQTYLSYQTSYTISSSNLPQRTN
ncbi:hypothetical protein WA026_010535 [Henosepilachna vigintioctopunctata]|uniref:Uncharacterized protein n=1 Tax=Henosepilachna vigintioctopunctata TaxID=420089 RepID=A0AAW1V5B8_9CUCU